VRWLALGLVLLLVTGCSGFHLRAKDTFEIEFSVGTLCDGNTHTIIREGEMELGR